jgi:biopolymer transport protein ExbD
MADAGDEQGLYDDINVTPMLDVAYVLLIVFILLTTATVQGIQVNLPKASAAPKNLAEPKTQAITIRNDGTIFLGTSPVTLPQLENLLRQYKAADPELPIIVKGDSEIQYQSVVDVLDLAARLEIYQIGLVTKKVVK